MQQEIKWYQGHNFWVAALMAIFGLWSGVQESDISGVVSAVFGLIGGIGMLREKIKASNIDFRAWLQSRNTWNYISAAATAILPTIPLDLFARLNDLISSILGKNYQGIISAVIAIGVIIYYWVMGAKKTASA